MRKLLLREQMHDYQANLMVPHILKNPNCALFVDMGLGKTVATLTALNELFNSFEINRVLIIAPLRVAKTVWQQETQAWAHTKGLTCAIATGTEAERLHALDQDVDIHIINRENVAWLSKTYRSRPGGRKSKYKKWRWDTVVIDESTSFKTPGSQRHKALKARRGFISRMIELTGSPAANGLKDLWGQIYLLDKGERLGTSLIGFRERYFEYNEWTREWIPRTWAEQAIYEKISDICLVLEAGDYIDLPDTIENNIVVDMPKSLRRQYKSLEEEFYIKLSESGDEVIALTGAALSGKLTQFCNGAVYTEQGKERESDKWSSVHDHKIDALKSVVEESNGNPILVAYNFKSDLARLQQTFPKAVVLNKDPATVDRWNSGDIQLLLVHPASGGHGLSLQHGGYITVWFGLNWSLEYYEQLNARLGAVRQKQSGTGKTPIIHHIVMRDSIDEVILHRLKTKGSIQDSLKNGIKDYQLSIA